MITKRLYINDEPTMYLINDEGQVYSEITHKFLKPFKNPQGYYLVDICHKGKSYTGQLHRLVALTFIPNPKHLETVNHKNGNKGDNSVKNLEWMSRLDNVRHAWRTGLAKPRYGVNNPANVYSEEQIHRVCQLLEVGYLNHRQIAEICGVNVTLIRDIKFRGKWKDISDLYDIPRVTSGCVKLRMRIIQLIDQGYSDDEIMDKLDLPVKSKHYVEYVRCIHKRSLNDYSKNGGTPVS